MIAATLFSGIGAPENAMPHWDWRWCAEIERFASAVLQERHPHTVNLGDVSADDFTERAAAIARPDVLVFGSPCQSFSVAGQRLGLDDPRGNLALVALGIVDRLKPRWFVFENVPGLLSSDQGRDFGIFLRTVDELGYRCAWSVLDAQYFGVAQRRERVFVVGHLGDWRRAAAVLLEPEGLRGNYPPSREKRERVASPIAAGVDRSSGYRNDADTADNLIAPSLTGSGRGVERTGESRGQDPVVVVPDIAWALQERDHKGADSDTKDGHLIVQAYDITGTGPGTINAANPTDVHSVLRSRAPGHSEGSTTTLVTAFDTTQLTSKTNRSTPQPGNPCHPLASGAHPPAVAVALRGREGGATAEVSEIPSALRASQGGGDKAHVMQAAVRRLTPIECERLQGFPDGYTQVVYRGKSAMDGPRYRALGNSMAVPVVRWILERIERVDGGRAWQEASS